MFHYLPDSSWADGNLAEAARQLGKLVEHRNKSQPNPCLRVELTEGVGQRLRLCENVIDDSAVRVRPIDPTPLGYLSMGSIQFTEH